MSREAANLYKVRVASFLWLMIQGVNGAYLIEQRLSSRRTQLHIWRRNERRSLITAYGG